jgi:ATP-binding cassette subfamily B protein
MGLTVIAILPIAMVLFPIVAKLRQGHAVAMQENLGILNSHVEESFTGHNIIKAFNNTKITCEEFERKNKKLSRSNFFADFFMQLFFPIGNLIQFLSMAAVYTVGIILIINNVITFGVMISFIIYANLFQQPFQQFAQIIGSMQTALAGAERVYNFLDEENQTPERPKLQKLDRKKLRGEVEFDHVRFGYNPNKIIIKDFSLHVKPGQKIAIVGPTGAGKTTIVNLIMRFYEINHGAIKIDGIDTRDLSRSDVRKLFGMVLQDT